MERNLTRHKRADLDSIKSTERLVVVGEMKIWEN